MTGLLKNKLPFELPSVDEQCENDKPSENPVGRTLDPGFVQSLEFLKKSGNLRTTFPDLEKVWKLKAKS